MFDRSFRAVCLTAVPFALPFALYSAAITEAQAHAVLQPKEATPNAAYRGVVQIMHGCEGAPTTRVSVTIPEGVIGAKPMPKPGWEITTTKGAYAKAYQSFHGKVSEGVKTITWSGGKLPDDQVDEFTFFARVSDAFEPGAAVAFPVQQDCEHGSIAWNEVPVPGQDAHALKSPAPTIRIVAAKVEAPAQAATTNVKAGDVTIQAPWLRATPGGAKVAGGYVTLVNTGAADDRLIGASIPQAGRGEVHSMSIEDGVMKMAPVAGGVAVEPGKTVALKPGGLHLMFLDLKDGLKAGETVTGTLTFEKAGTITVRFPVAPIGAQGPGGGVDAAAGGHQHH